MTKEIRMTNDANAHWKCQPTVVVCTSPPINLFGSQGLAHLYGASSFFRHSSFELHHSYCRSCASRKGFAQLEICTHKSCSRLMSLNTEILSHAANEAR